MVVENKGYDSYLAESCSNIVFATNWGESDVILPIGGCVVHGGWPWFVCVVMGACLPWAWSFGVPQPKMIEDSFSSMYSRKTSTHMRRSKKWACLDLHVQCLITV